MIYLPQIDTSASLQVCHWILDLVRDEEIAEARRTYSTSFTPGSMSLPYMNQLLLIGFSHWMDWQNAVITYYEERWP